MNFNFIQLQNITPKTEIKHSKFLKVYRIKFNEIKLFTS